MEPMTMMAIAAGIGAVTPLIGQLFASGDRAAAEELRQRAMKEYNINLPPIEAIAIESQAAQAQGDKEARSARMEALRGLSQRAREGYTAEDIAAINATMGDISAQERGAREAIMRRLPPKSGAQTAALLSNQQAAAQQANKIGLEVAAGSRRAALQGIAAAGQLGGQIEQDAFQQSLARGQAADAIRRFNEENRMRGRQLTNQQMYDLAQGRANALGGQANMRQAQAQQIMSGVGGTGQAVSSGLGQLAMYQAEQQNPVNVLRRKKAQDELDFYGSDI